MTRSRRPRCHGGPRRGVVAAPTPAASATGPTVCGVDDCRRRLALSRFALVASADSDLRAGSTPVGKPPRAALVLAVEEVFTHCPKAFVRSGRWDAETWPSKDDMPWPAAMLRDHVGDPDFTLEQAGQAMVDSVTIRLS